MEHNTTRCKAKRMTYNAKNGYCKYMGYALYALKINIFNNYDGVIENIREVTKEILGSAKLFQTPSASFR